MSQSVLPMTLSVQNGALFSILRKDITFLHFNTVHFQIVWTRGVIDTLVAFVWLFSAVCFQMYYQIASLCGFKITLVPFHPDPGPIANVQVWEQRASEFWRFVACFFVTIHFSDAPVTLRRSPFQKCRKADAPRFFKPYGMWHNCWMAKTID